MLNDNHQEILDSVINQRTATLAEIIRTGNEASATMAAIKLAFIGAKHSTDALMDIIRTTEDKKLCKMLVPLIGLSPHLNDHLEELERFIDKETITVLRDDIEHIDPRLTETLPLWQEIAEALEKNFDSQLATAIHGTTRGQGGFAHFHH